MKKRAQGEKLIEGCYARLHFFVPDESAAGVTPRKVLVPMSPLGPIVSGGFRGRIACSRSLPVAPEVIAGVHCFTMHTNEVRAVTCPECMATTDFKKAEAEVLAPAKPAEG